MSVSVSPVSTQALSRPAAVLPENASAGFEERWLAWQVRGAAHHRAARRKMVIAAPVVGVVVALIYLLLLR